MKKQKQNFDTMFWAGNEIKNAIKVIEAVFSYASLDHYKQIVNNAVLYAQKPEVYNKHEPCELFRCYAILRSFYRACAKLESKNKKKKEFQIHTTCKSILHQASLSEVEYDNPIIVFKKALTENAVKDYECFFASMVEMALSHHQLDYEPNWFNYYLHTVKMLDASQLLLESNNQKVKIKKKAVEVQTQLPQIHKNLLLVSSRNNHNETITNEPIIGEEKDQNQKCITEIITATVHTYGIYCFGEKQIQEIISGVHSETKLSKITHYYVMAIVKNLPSNAMTDIAYHIKEKSNGKTTVTLLLHTLTDLRRNKTNKHYFFQKIVFEGTTWYENWQETVPLNLAEANQKDLNEIKEYWYNRKVLTDGFMEAATAIADQNLPGLQISLWHQAVEKLCLGLIHTFLQYRPQHYALGYLFELCELFTSTASHLFPQKNKEEIMLLKPLFRPITDLRNLKLKMNNKTHLALIEQRCQLFHQHAATIVEQELKLLNSP